jgi:hypothetical protein
MQTATPPSPVSDDHEDPHAESSIAESSIVDSSIHGSKVYNRKTEQNQLVHGIDMGVAFNPDDVGVVRHGFARGIVNGAAWRKVLGGTELAYVKPHYGGPSMMASNAEAEGLYYNLMTDFFGLGKYIPTVGVFKHPISGAPHHVIRAIPQAAHWEANPQQYKTLLETHEKGDLDKLYLQNAILQNSDRHMNNFMFGNNDSTLHMIDHGFTFSGRDAISGGHMPSYAHTVQQYLSANPAVEDMRAVKLHPKAREWLLNLDPEVLRDQMENHHAPKIVIDRTEYNLREMQKYAAANPEAGAQEVWASSAPDSYRFRQAQEFRLEKDPAYQAQKRKRLEEEEENHRLQIEHGANRFAMEAKLAALWEKNPDKDIHEIAQMGGYSTDKRHALLLQFGKPLGDFSPLQRVVMDYTLEARVKDRLAEFQLERHQRRKYFVEDAAYRMRQFDVKQREHLDVAGGRRDIHNLANELGVEFGPDEKESDVRNKINAEFGPKVEDKIRSLDVSEAGHRNDEMEDEKNKANYRHFRNLMSMKLSLGRDGRATTPSEREVADLLPEGKDLDDFAKAIDVMRGTSIGPRQGRDERQYRAHIAHRVVHGGHDYMQPFVNTLKENAELMKEDVSGLAQSVIGYFDGGYDANGVVERLAFGFAHNESHNTRILNYLGIDPRLPEKLDWNKKVALAREVYRKLVNTPIYKQTVKTMGAKRGRKVVDDLRLGSGA